MVKLPQVLLNVPVTASMNLDSPAIQGVTRQVEEALHGRGRLLLRPSGTEPVIRVMVEGDCLEEIQAHAQRVADVLTAVA